MTNAVRVLFIIGLIGSFTSPALTNISLALAVIALLAVPSEWGRLARAATAAWCWGARVAGGDGRRDVVGGCRLEAPI